jgi:hypothetical protein
MDDGLAKIVSQIQSGWDGDLGLAVQPASDFVVDTYVRLNVGFCRDLSDSTSGHLNQCQSKLGTLTDSNRRISP